MKPRSPTNNNFYCPSESTSLDNRAESVPLSLERSTFLKGKQYANVEIANKTTNKQ